MARFTTAITALLLLGCASTASGTPRTGTWLSYQGSISFASVMPSGANFIGGGAELPYLNSDQVVI